MYKYLLLLFFFTLCINVHSISYAEDPLIEDLLGEGQNVREPAVAGRFYPESEAELSKKVNNYLDKAFIESLPGKTCGHNFSTCRLPVFGGSSGICL